MRVMHAFTALAEPNRLKIIELLAAHGALSAGQIGGHFPMTAAAISQHLKVLREAKLVVVQARAQRRIYTLNPHGLNAIERWAETMKMLWESQIELLQARLDKEAKLKSLLK